MVSRKKDNKKPQIKKRLFEVLGVIGITAIMILLMEGILSLFFPQNLRGEKVIGDSFFNRDKVLGASYTPGSRWRFSHPEYKVEYTINKDGFRDRKKHPVPKPEATLRVLLVGDSFTFGQAVGYDQIWPVLVERQLKEKGYDQIDLVKAGIQGLDTRSEFLLIQRLLKKYDCDVVVVGFLINDLYTNSLYGIDDLEEMSNGTNDNVKEQSKESWTRSVKKVFMKHDQKQNFHLLTFAKRLALSSDELYCKLYMASANRGEWFNMPLSETSKQQVEVTEILFNKIAEYCRSLNKKLIVFSIPQQFQVLYNSESQDIDVSRYDKHFAKFAAKNGFDWVASLGAFKEQRFDEDLFYRHDGHLNRKGNEVAAEIFIQKILPLLKVDI